MVWMVNMIQHHYPEAWSMRNVSLMMANFVHYMWRYCIKYDDPRLIVQYELGISEVKQTFGTNISNVKQIFGICRSVGNIRVYRTIMCSCYDPLKELHALATMYSGGQQHVHVTMGKCLMVSYPNIIKCLARVPREDRMCVLLFMQTCLSQLSSQSHLM